MAVPRPLLIPWLQEQINSGQYPGVFWVNDERTQFCVPWKHGLRQDSSSTDILIFQAWAEVSGSYVPGQTPPDPSVWKRNFRSALRAKGFTVIKDEKNDSANPHKVFQLPQGDQQRSAERTSGRRTREQRDTAVNRGGAKSSGFQEAVDHPSPPQVHFPPLQNVFVEAAPFHNTFGTLHTPEQAALSTGDRLQEILRELSITEDNGVPQDVARVREPLGAYSSDGVETAHEQQRLVEEFKETMSRTVVDDSLSTQFRVSVYYRGVKVLERTVENCAGFRLLFSPDQMPDYEPNLELVSLPSPEEVSIFDQKQAQLTKRILEKMGTGLEVTVQGSAISARRQGDSRVYWSLCKYDRSNIPRKVGREHSTIYTMKDFIAGLLEFMKNGGESPSYTIFFCLGEMWPDPAQKPWEKKLIMVEVVVTSLEVLKMIAVDGGASSLQSVELQLSDTPSLLDMLEEFMDIY